MNPSLRILSSSAILFLALSACDRSPAPTPVNTPAAPPKAAAPAASLPQINLDGIQKLIAEAKANKQILVLDFWATWCVPCIELFPGLHEQTAKLGDRVKVISITLDTPGDAEENAIKFLTEQHANKDAYMLDPDTDARVRTIQGLSKQWKNLVVPAILIYDREGNLADEFLGDVELEPIMGKIRSILSSPGEAQPS